MSSDNDHIVISHIWFWLDDATKRALRLASRSLLRSADSEVRTATVPRSARDVGMMEATFRRWPNVSDLILHRDSLESFAGSSKSALRLRGLTLVSP